MGHQEWRGPSTFYGRELRRHDRYADPRRNEQRHYGQYEAPFGCGMCALYNDLIV